MRRILFLAGALIAGAVGFYLCLPRPLGPPALLPSLTAVACAALGTVLGLLSSRHGVSP